MMKMRGRSVRLVFVWGFVVGEVEDGGCGVGVVWSWISWSILVVDIM